MNEEMEYYEHYKGWEIHQVYVPDTRDNKFTHRFSHYQAKADFKKGRFEFCNEKIRPLKTAIRNKNQELFA